MYYYCVEQIIYCKQLQVTYRKKNKKKTFANIVFLGHYTHRTQDQTEHSKPLRFIHFIHIH